MSHVSLCRLQKYYAFHHRIFLLPPFSQAEFLAPSKPGDRETHAAVADCYMSHCLASREGESSGNSPPVTADHRLRMREKHGQVQAMREYVGRAGKKAASDTAIESWLERVVGGVES